MSIGWILGTAVRVFSVGLYDEFHEAVRLMFMNDLYAFEWTNPESDTILQGILFDVSSWPVCISWVNLVCLTIFLIPESVSLTFKSRKLDQYSVM